MVHFYITNTFQYDYEVAENPEPWYLPSAKRLVTTNQGICYDMASVTSSLLREMQVPTHVVMGYAKNIDVYHAWNEVYIDKSWKIIDTTFDLGGISESPYKEPLDYTQVHYRF
jgi:transglutaminase/protease-like cytokinesis protein 3